MAAATAVPIEKDYLLPAAPPVAVIPAAPEVINLPSVTPVVENVGVTVARAGFPFAPAPLRFLNPAPLPVARVAPAPIAAPIPLAAGPLRAALPFPAPLARAPLARAPLVAAAPAPIPAPLAARVPVAAPLAAPVPVAAPLAAPVPVPAPSVSSQFHAQDEFGGFSFGYQDGNSAKQEVRTADGVTRGSYSYVDANGLLQTVEYIADPINGFRVAGTNLPVFSASGPVTPVVPAVAGPVAPSETAEVIAARAEFQRAFEEAVARNAEALANEPVVAKTATISLKKREAIENDYLLPAAPVVRVVPVPVAAPAPQVVNVVRSHTVTPLVAPAPLLPAPLRVAPAPLPVAAPAPLARRLIPGAALPFPAPLGARLLPAPVGFPTPVAAPQVVPAPIPAAIPAPGPVVVKAAPEPVPVIPAAAPVPLAASSQFQAQDEAGAFSFGYQNDLSARQETRTADGITRGSYSYVDANGITQTVNYIADPINGFQVEGTNLPVAPVA